PPHPTHTPFPTRRSSDLPEQPELPEHREGTRPRLLELTLHRLLQPARLRSAEPELRGGVPVALALAGGNHRAWSGLDDGDRHEHALRSVDLRHAELASDQTGERHGYWSLISTSTPAARSSLPSL